jgi:hypothetical protein
MQLQQDQQLRLDLSGKPHVRRLDLTRGDEVEASLRLHRAEAVSPSAGRGVSDATLVHDGSAAKDQDELELGYEYREGNMSRVVAEAR